MSRVLVTGADGFTGRYVIEALSRDGHEAIGTTRREGGPALVALELSDAEAVQRALETLRPDAIIHLAAVAFVAHGDLTEMFSANVVGTRNLLAAASAMDAAPRTVLVSSANVYGNATAGTIAETAPLMPANEYGISKLCVEHLARIWSPRLPVVVTRPFNYTGVGQSERFLIPKIVAHYARRAPRISLGNIEPKRDYSDVRMVAEVYARLITAAEPPEVVNIASGHSHSVKDILAIMTEITGHEIAVEIDPRFVRADEIMELKGDRRRLDESLPNLPNIALKQTLAWMLHSV
ncbi:Nucleoside-diphosphate-sugar epimerase [Fulvimarina manganoxydans]|uniref:Nucleoside-diphosphate-sugar epimerase n=1 Tax=Fulvimarina manganoxydans TaxID=937218 RepID=A0A1W2AM42_9HYPH|nr:GDP-mannose 4,6-dehydratase [Fulvimarina manganoxydans]SMC61582.1 Nucleoside-diphosphate-sugar epimerase [Fulvimarina manganoxydans]